MNLRKTVKEHPLLFVLICAFFVRFIAVIFSKGYMAHDDHFCVVEYAWKLIKTGSFGFMGDMPYRSFFYPGLNYILISLGRFLGLTNPDTLMFFNRLFHALFSLLTVFFGYKIAEKTAGKKAAFFTGMLLSFYFIMPFIAVRQLIEHVSSVLLISSLYFAYSYLEKNKQNLLFLSGILMGIAFMVRFQAAVCAFALFLYFIFKKNIKESIVFSAGFLIIFILQGFLDLATYGKFMASPVNYVIYNMKHSSAYVNGPWYNYILLILAAFVPPFSFFLAAGMIKSFKKIPVIAVPAAAFFVLHSIFPGKQERFILPILPLLIVMGVTGLYLWDKEKGIFSKNFYKISLYFFWILNTIVLVPATLNYSQKARVEPMLYLNSQNDVSNVILDMTEEKLYAPKFYFTGEADFYRVLDEKDLKNVAEKANGELYAVVFTAEKAEKHVRMLERNFPDREIKLQKHITPSLIDKILHLMNPKYNKAKESRVYKIL